MAIPSALWGTPERYELWLGTIEVVEATNPDDAGASTVDADRLGVALELAKQVLAAADYVACPPGKLLLRNQLEYLQYLLTRHNLDTLKTREDVKDGFAHVQKVIEDSRSSEVCDMPLDEALAEELGILPDVDFAVVSQARTWSSDLLSRFKTQRYLR